MIILEDKCIGCNLCLPYCPASAIREMPAKGIATVVEDDCVECGVCYRSEVCPVDAIYPQDLEWPRTLRAEFSDPSAPYMSPIFVNQEIRTWQRDWEARGAGPDRKALLDRKGADLLITGRGTAEMKTNDVTGRFKHGRFGMAVEVGRGGGGTRFREVEKISKALAKIGVQFEKRNPFYSLLVGPEGGALLPDILSEKVLSCIIEFDIPCEMLPRVLGCLQEVAAEVDCVFVVDLISVVDHDGCTQAEKMTEQLGVPVSINGKVNVGLGRPLANLDA